MIRKSGSDRSGNYALISAIAMVPLMGAVALAVDYAEMVRERQATLNALDTAGIAAARQIASGASDSDVKAYAKNFFEANLSRVDPADNNRSTYAAYGYTGLTYPESGSVTRLFMNTSSNVGKTTYTDANYTAVLDEQLQTLCTNAKNSNILVMTVALDLSTTNTGDKKAIDALKACSSDSRFRKDPTDPTKPAKLFWNATGATLSDNFKEIADELSNLRIVR